MPHLHIRSFKPTTLPKEVDGYTFKFLATNVHHSDERLIAVSKGASDFFLLVKDGPKGSLLKSDKIARPAKKETLHHAIDRFSKLADLEVLQSNLNLQEKSVHLVDDSALKTIDFFAKEFPKDRAIHIEVGFGSGRHLLHQAKADPDALFIGIEIYRPSIEQVLKQINIQKIDNILLLDYDARLFLEFVPSNVVKKIYVHFPVPWDKKPHRRVISKDFVAESIRVLQVGGQLELRTDSENYYQYSYATFMSLNQLSLQIHKNREIAVSSKYEDRWRKMEKNIYDITLINSEISEDNHLSCDFSFDKTKPIEGLERLYGKTKKLTNGFIHFERLYTIDEKSIMFRLSLGSFERPLHLYLIIEDQKARYYPSVPIASKANIEAHLRLNELLHG